MEGSNAQQPSIAEMMAVAQQALKTAEEAKTAAEAREQVAATVKEEGEAKGWEITEEQAKMIASVTIAELEERGAFSSTGEANPEPMAEPPAPQGEAAPPPSPEPVAAPPEQNPPAPAVASEEESPRKKSLAERFQGK